MNKRPKYLSLLSAVFVMIALSYPLQVMVLYGHSLFEIDQIFFKISTLNFLVMFSLLCNAYLLLNASSLLKFTIPTTLALVMWSNAIIGSYGSDYSMSSTSLASLLFALLCTPLMAVSEIQLVLSNPKTRWWLTPKRVKKNLTTAMQQTKGLHLIAETHDISESGLFIPFSTCVEKETKEYVLDPRLKVGEVITLHIRLSQFNTIKCEARVIRVSQKPSSKPAGLGLQFLQLDEHAKTQIKKYVSMAA